MARFQRDAEIYELWVEGPRFYARRYAIDAAPPVPQLRLEAAGAGYPDETHEAHVAYGRLHSELLRDGWQRVRDPARERAVLDEPRDPALDAALRENPDDHASLLVYADLLQQAGHPRGPLIGLEASPLAQNQVARAQMEAESERLRRRAINVLAAGLMEEYNGLHILDWRYGFIAGVRLGAGFDRTPGERPDMLFEVLRHPSARFVRDLTLSLSTRDSRWLVDLLLSFTPAPPLRKLTLEPAPYCAPMALGDVVELSSVYPLLEAVVLEGSRETELDGLAFPRARRFAWRSDRLTRRELAPVLAAPWPVLEDLELRVGTDSECTLADFAPLLDGTVAVPALTRLRLHDVGFPDELIEALVRSPLAARLEDIDLGDSRPNAWTTALLTERFPRLRHDWY